MRFLAPVLVFVTFTLANPVGENESGANRKRQFNGFFGSLAGLIGISASYDYVIVGGTFIFVSHVPNPCLSLCQ